jgi:hypothetical protein
MEITELLKIICEMKNIPREWLKVLLLRPCHPARGASLVSPDYQL